MRSRITLGVREKFIAANVGIILVLGLFSTLFVYVTTTQTLTKELQERGVVIARDLAANSAEAILTEDLLTLRRVIFDVKRAGQDIAYVYVMDSNGNILAHTFEEGFPKALLDIGAAHEKKAQLLETEEGFIRDITMPVLEGRGGYVHVGISENAIRQRVEDATRAVLVLTLAAGTVGMLLAYLAGSLITRPIYSLKKIAEEIGKGNLGVVAQESTDEVGVLARAFNQMARELRKSMGEIKEYSAHLEQKVEDKTKELLLLQSINNMLNTGANLEEILRAVTRGIVSVFSYDSCAVHLLSEDKSALICKGYYMDSELVRRVEALTGVSAIDYVTPLHEGNPLLKVVQAREPLITNDIPALIKNHTTDKRLQMLAEPIAKIFGTKWGIGVPLLAGDKVVGVIGVGSKSALSHEDAKRLANFAAQVGLAVEKARLEKEIKTYSEQLERKVEEKTRQLIQSEKLASLGQLAAGVAHEINNPLTNIMLDAEALKRRSVRDEDAKKRAEEIISQVEAVKRIVNNLLEFSRRAEPEMGIVDASQLIEKTLLMLSHQLKGINVEKKYDAGLRIKGDFNQLQQVLLNIMLNAVQAMQGEGRLGIKAGTNGELVEIEISDSGPGIPEENLSRIFEPFFTTKRRGEGTGLGLYIARDIVERHNGAIKVESRTGEGSRFIIKLPRA